jgi:Flp pilus assembly CpaF family ATPase/MinD superfamily P-loop ATPase
MNATVVVLISAKGGSGASTLSVGLAEGLQRKGEVTLVDGDVMGRRNIAVLTDSIRALDSMRESENVSVARAARQLTIVEMSPSFDAGFTIKMADVEVLAVSVCEAARFVVLDANQPFSGAVRPFAVRAAKFFVVAEPTLLGAACARNMLHELTKFGISRTLIEIVINGRSGHVDISRGEFEKVVGASVTAEFPQLGDRRYKKTMESFAEHVAALAANEELLQMAPSGRAAGDRRSGAGRRVEPGAEAPAPAERTGATAAQRSRREARDRLKTEIHESLAKRLDMVMASRGTDAEKLAELRGQVSATVTEIMQGRSDMGTAEEVVSLRQEIVDEALGYGPIEDLLRDPEVSEIMVNGCDHVYVERAGKLEKTAKRFTNNAQLRLVIERMIAPIGRRIDESSPLVDARLADGSRVNAVIEPLAIDGPTLTIRRFGSRRLKIEDLVRLGAVSESVVAFLRAIVEARLNIVVSGGTGSGKTTFLNILSGYIPYGERIVTIEDAAELKLDQEHVVRLESRPPNLQGKGEVAIRDLMKNALRMRPDRILVGECRSGEALDMLQAMNTGHDGSLTTVHANSARDALSRIETMVMMAGYELPIKAIREQVSSAIDIVVQISRMRDGSRKVVGISEVVGMEGEIITMQEIVRFVQNGLDKQGKVVGVFEFSGVQPYCMKRFEELGISFDVRSLKTNRAPEPAKW